MPEPYYLQMVLDEICNIHWHLFNLGRIELLNIPHHSYILSSDKVDSNTNIRIFMEGCTLYVQNVHHVQFCGCSFHGWRGDRS
jgi:hypothetical protein